jgi:hypothetical protein
VALHGPSAGPPGARAALADPVGDAARTITALTVLREQVLAPILAGVRSPRQDRKPAARTRIDRDYETLRINMHTLFADLELTSAA